MKIFDYADLGDKRSWDYQNDDTPEVDGIEPVFTTDKKVEIGQVLIINNIAFTTCSISYKGQNNPVWCLVEKLKNQNVFIRNEEPEEQDYKNEVTCPYCGYEEGDSWEMTEYEEEHECSNCGSTYSYQRNVTVEYCSQPIKKAEYSIIS